MTKKRYEGYLTEEEKAFINQNRDRIRALEARMAKAEELLPTKDMIDYTKLTKKQIEILKSLFHLGEFTITQGVMLGYTGRAFGAHVRRFVELGICRKVRKGVYRFCSYKVPKADLERTRTYTNKDMNIHKLVHERTQTGTGNSTERADIAPR